MSKYQIHIIAATELDVAKTLEIFLKAAGKFNLYDNTFTSQATGTICSYTEGEFFGFGLGALQSSGKIVLRFNPNSQKTKRPEDFELIYQFIRGEAQAVFLMRATFPAPADFIEPDRAIPLSEEVKQRMMKLLRAKWKREGV